MAEAREPVLAIGTIFQGGYEILSRLGAGRFGAVYKARQLSTGQDVAIKVLRILFGDTAADIENQTARFRREMRLCAGMSHPNIVRLIDSGEAEDGMLYAVFECVPGATLREVLATEGKLGLPETLHLMSEVLDALACAHARGVVHRDLKPDNIMVSKTGARRHALVLDFGLGGLTVEAETWMLPRITQTNEMMGTPCYAAPEQLRGEAPTTRSDLYSWGLVFLECLTGELAMGGASGPDVIMKQLGPEPVPIPAWLRQQRLGRLLEIVTAKAVEKRDVTIGGMLEALGTMEVNDRAPEPRAPRPEQLSEGERRQLTVVSCRLTLAPLERGALDPEEVDEVLHARHALWGEIAARGGGQMAGVLADRVLLVFGYPRAREDDARRAARAALEVSAEAERAGDRLAEERRLRLEVRIGVHTGLVVVRELRQATYQGLYDLVGLTPQVAARIDEQAVPGQVLVSGDTMRLLRGEIDAQPAGETVPWPHAAGIPIFRLTADRRRQGLETIPWTRETPLVGRAAPLRDLLDLWSAVQVGRPAAVLLGGEPGIGKSRLVRELRRRVPTEGWLDARCMAENQASPLRPIVDLLLAGREPIEALLSRHGFDLAHTLPLFAALLSQPLDPRYEALAMTPDLQKERTLRAILELLLRMAQERPLVLALEDIHWADPTTLELMTLLVQEVRGAQIVTPDPPIRLGLVFTARPELALPWSLEDVAQVQLARLARGDVEEMIVAGLTTGRTLPRRLLDRVIDCSDGVPLFVEEITRVLIHSGAGQGDEHGGAADDRTIDVPGTLRELLTARLDQLSTSARETIQIAAALGREFRYETIETVARKDESLLREDVRELMDAGLLFARRSLRSEAYVFKHSLVRDAAYDSMTRPRRQRLHARVASTLRERFPEVAETQPELLALHFEQGGEAETAIEFWLRAGERALVRAAYVEALQQLERGRALLGTLPESSRRRRQEIELLTALGTAHISTKGFGSPEVDETFARARLLCERVGDDIPLKVLGGIFGVQVTRADPWPVAEILPHFRRLASRTDDPAAAFAGHQVLGVHAFWSGDLLAAREHTAAGMRLYDGAGVKGLDWEYGYGVYCYGYQMTSLYQLGYADQAEVVRREIMAIAERSRNPYCRMIALAMGGTLLHDCGRTAEALEMAERLSALASEQRMYFWLALAHCDRGGALVQRGDTEAGIEQTRQGLDLCKTIGILSSYSYYLTYLAGGYLAAGKLPEGLAVVDEGLGMCGTHLARFHEPELWRLKGELLERGGERGAAESAFRRAIDQARERQGRSMELRAATSLARLLQGEGKCDQARSVLADVYGWFTEGFDASDLTRARALLAELGTPGRGMVGTPTSP